MDIYNKIIEMKKENRNFVLVSVVKSTGSTPGKSGFKMIVDEKGNAFGTVGGGAIEKEAIEESKRMMASKNENHLQEYTLSSDETIVDPEAKIVPMSCHGKIWLFYEIEKNKPVVYIFGGGHVGQALIDLLQNMNYYIVLIDNRQEMFEKNKARGINCIYSDYKSYTEQFIPSEDAYFIVVTYGHVHDYEILKTLYQRNLVTKYVGVIASRSKSNGMIKNLKADINDALDLSKLHTPIGLKIGGDTAYEIALSIAAEIQSVRYDKKIIIDAEK